MRRVMARALAAARALPFSNRQALNRGFQTSSTRLEREMTEAGELLNRLGDSPELNSAFAAEPACQAR